eukprot:SAG11_NODE_9051_length_949_cov_0.785882_3_plen_55_part_01
MACPRIPGAIASTRDGGWATPELPHRREVAGKTVGIIGFGNVGRQVNSWLFNYNT